MMLEPPRLESARLVLRKLVLADAEALRIHADDELVWRNMFDGFPRPYTLENAQNWCTKDAHDEKMGYVWGIECDAQTIGCISARPDAGWLRCNAEIGYWIGRGYWRRGIASEALGLVMQWAQNHLTEVTRFYAPVFSWNQASQKVLKKNGFTQEALLPRSAIKAGQIIDRLVLAKYRE